MSTESGRAGYSKRSLVDKLGIKAGCRLAILQAPAGYTALLGDLPADVVIDETMSQPLAFIHFFTASRADLETNFPRLKAALMQNGKLWISWPKRAAKVATDLDENIVREIGLANGLVDVKVAAMDATWSGLQFVYRLKDRR
jgi:hypothetical protein